MPEVNFFWDDLSDNILQERDESGTVMAEYTSEPGLYGNLVSQNRGGVESQYHFDPQGSTLALTDDNQQVTDTYAYSAFGEVTEHSNTTINPFRYIGRKGYYLDSQFGTYGVRRRIIVTQHGRWLATDPMLVSLSTHLSLGGHYSYVSNDPLNHIDPSGLVQCCLMADSFVVKRVIATLELEEMSMIYRYAAGFRVMASFDPRGPLCAARCCEYRQYIRGFYKVDEVYLFTAGLG